MEDNKIILPPSENEYRSYDDGNIPEIDLPGQNVEPLPESTRPRKDGPGGN